MDQLLSFEELKESLLDMENHLLNVRNMDKDEFFKEITESQANRCAISFSLDAIQFCGYLVNCTNLQIKELMKLNKTTLACQVNPSLSLWVVFCPVEGWFNLTDVSKKIVEHYDTCFHIMWSSVSNSEILCCMPCKSDRKYFLSTFTSGVTQNFFLDDENNNELFARLYVYKENGCMIAHF